jgi:hypothetical protein
MVKTTAILRRLFRRMRRKMRKMRAMKKRIP